MKNVESGGLWEEKGVGRKTQDICFYPYLLIFISQLSLIANFINVAYS